MRVLTHSRFLQVAEMENGKESKRKAAKYIVEAATKIRISHTHIRYWRRFASRSHWFSFKYCIAYVCALALSIWVSSAECVCKCWEFTLPHYLPFVSANESDAGRCKKKNKTITTTATTNVNPIQWRLYLYSCLFLFFDSLWFSLCAPLDLFSSRSILYAHFLWFLFYSLYVHTNKST